MTTERVERPFSSSEALRFGWTTVRANLRPVLILGVVAGFLALLHQALSRPMESPGIAPLLAIAVQVLQAAVVLTFLRVALLLHDGKPVDLARPQLLLADFFTYLLTTLLLALIIMGGLALLIVPGVMWALKFGYAPFLVADGQPDPIEALRESARITEGVRKQLLGFAASCVVVNLLGAMAFGVGVLVTWPTTLIAAAYILRRLQARSKARAAEPRATPEAPNLPPTQHPAT